MTGLPPQAPMGMPAPQPAMVMNPAFIQWAQMKQAWDAETMRRQGEFLAACQLIREDARNSYKIDIEADSTVAADQLAEQKSRTEFLQSITPFLEVVIPGLMANPALAPLGKALGMFAVRAFPVSRDLDDAFETAFDAMEKQSGTVPQQPQGGKNTKSPEEVAAETQVANQKAQVDMQSNAVKLQQIQSQEHIAEAKMVQDQIQHEQSLALQGREMAGREALDQARISRIAARNTQGLV